MNERPIVAGKLVTSDDWDKKWSGVFEHYQHDKRHSYYIDAIRRRDEKRVLEIAAGSFRDIARLSQLGVEGHAIDFSVEAVHLAREYYPHLADRFSAMDAFRLDYPDNHFDLTYHNGFWAMFDDESIRKLAIEQARVTRGRMIATVHNAHNKKFKAYFDHKVANGDNLYDIRFFECDQLNELMSTVCSKVTIFPVGKGKQGYEDWLIRKGLGYPALIKFCFSLSGHHLLKQSERLLCIGEID